MKLRFIFSLINSAVMWLSAWTPLSLHPPPQSPMLMETSLMPLICWPGQVKNISTQSEPGLQVSWGCQTEAPPVFIAFLKELHIDLFLFFFLCFLPGQHCICQSRHQVDGLFFLITQCFCKSSLPTLPLVVVLMLSFSGPSLQPFFFPYAAFDERLVTHVFFPLA